MRVLIVDDEELGRRGVRTRLQPADDIEIVAECRNGREAIKALRTLSVDLVFLDVQMPGKSGFEVIEAIGCENVPAVIFVTAYDQHALRAFEVNAIDYLLKPIDDERFEIALRRARESMARSQDSDFGRRLASLLKGVTAGRAPTFAADDRLVCRSSGRIVFVKTSELDWIEAAGDYVTLHSGKKTWLLRQSITNMERQLDSRKFVRIHRSTIVNLERIAELRSLDNGEYRVILRDNAEVKLSRSYRNALDRLIRR